MHGCHPSSLHWAPWAFMVMCIEWQEKEVRDSSTGVPGVRAETKRGLTAQWAVWLATAAYG
eukprot:CAMPEP_0196664282 /NCGR_PEP_ID=MMETSP1086-20130531/56513_1 /TAXON_ID=77921 /ORGANISM="Cyanoptyche  gloeocystis , Strain SAG4.97" /LENGTH=60 /DNA_ID=CAMNT_0042000529 /DNA_START=385 /DNA_END=567 /DNA_ORIENTATION=-